jgi:putative nucleotidyltransferase with HDIG domain
MNQESILIVDDDPSITAVIADTVISLGHDCLTAADGSEALDLVRNSNFEIVISDIRLPGLDGLELMEKTRQIKPNISFIITTGYTVDYQHDAIVGLGANDFIRKPFNGNEVKRKVNRILRERQLVRENNRLLKKQVALNRKLSAILQVSRNLTAEMNFDDLFKAIILKTTQIMEAERTSLYIIDWESREVWTKFAECVDEIRLPMGQGISGHVAENGDTINVEDASSLPYFNSEFDSKHNFHTRSVLCMPVNNHKKKRIGVLQVLNKKSTGRFDRNDQMLLEAIASQVGIALENSILLDELKFSFESSVRTLSATVDAKHPLTAGHSERVTEYSLMIAREMGLGEEDLEIIKYAALLHDIGKIGIRDQVLLKDGAFSPDERAEMNTHPVRTREILKNFHFPKRLLPVPGIASQHHEKVNGKGYPDGLAGTELPLGSKILAVADVFDAMTSRRDYPKYCSDGTHTGCGPVPLPKVIRTFKKNAGTHFDPHVISTFLKCLPRALQLYRGSHFSPDYVDETIHSLSVEPLVFS